MITIEQFNNWKEDPATKEIMELFKLRQKVRAQILFDGDFLSTTQPLANATTLIEAHNIYDEFLTLQYEELIKAEKVRTREEA